MNPTITLTPRRSALFAGHDNTVHVRAQFTGRLGARPDPSKTNPLQAGSWVESINGSGVVLFRCPAGSHSPLLKV